MAHSLQTIDVKTCLKLRQTCTLWHGDSLASDLAKSSYAGTYKYLSGSAANKCKKAKCTIADDRDTCLAPMCSERSTQCAAVSGFAGVIAGAQCTTAACDVANTAADKTACCAQACSAAGNPAGQCASGTTGYQHGANSMIDAAATTACAGHACDVSANGGDVATCCKAT